MKETTNCNDSNDADDDDDDEEDEHHDIADVLLTDLGPQPLTITKAR